MKSIIFIGCYEFGTSREALTIAKEMGYFIVLLTNREKFKLKNHNLQDVDHLVFINNLLDEKSVTDEITKLKDNGLQICACISFIDPYISYTARLAKRLGLVEISENSLFIMENKIRFREKLKELSTSPFFTIIDFDTPIDQFVQKYISFLPLILKSPSSNGSKDVFLVDDTAKLEYRIRYLQKKYPRQPILAEEYLLGPQFLIEVLVHNNEMTVVGVIKQEVINNGRFIVTGYQFPANLNDEDHMNLHVSIKSIIDQLGLSCGSCHLEMRYVQGDWKLIEINPRMSGGTMNRIIEEGTGINLVKEILKMHLGEQPSLKVTQQQHVYAKYLTIYSPGKLLKIVGTEQALEHKGVKYVYIKPKVGSILTPPFSMGYRYACIIASAESSEHAKQIALEASKKIKFYLEPL
ncbi:ATP-grasp domain-containing protein [Heyndrickxia sp. NPDC080065]|uniref:ATP-grasp domain-containing protein n=1 Tax=Heyndrickxia sp. NPDC080065 TaxID=3390568 RepID=UPI003D058806